MALFLIFDHDNTHADPAKDRRGCYKLGDIFEVLDDSAHDGNLTRNPVVAPWYLIRVTGVTQAQVLHAMEPEVNALDLETILTRRKFRLNVADIPTSIRNRLQRDRYIEVTPTQARAYVRNKITGEAV